MGRLRTRSVERRRERLRHVVNDALAMAKTYGRGILLTPVSVESTSLVLTASSCQHLIILAWQTSSECLRGFRNGRKLRRADCVTARRQPTSPSHRDNGKGIIEGEVIGKTLFIPGRRNKSKMHSTGYGLPIARRNIAAHGGSLAIQSGEDKGTVITMTLPEVEEL